MSSVLKQISQGGLDITKTLRHVTDDQKAYKQAEREVRTVDEAELKKAKQRRLTAGKHATAQLPVAGEARTQLEGDKKWIIQYHRGVDEAGGSFDDDERRVRIILPADEIKRKHAVFISRCVNAYVRIAGKVNSIQMVECYNVQVELDDSVGPFEVTASTEAEVLIHGVVPNVIMGKVKGILIHLDEAAVSPPEFVTSCTTGVRITVPVVDSCGEKDRIELPVPEQFHTKIVKRNKLETGVVEHSGA